jgi:hypothetical protein
MRRRRRRRRRSGRAYHVANYRPLPVAPLLLSQMILVEQVV